MKFKEFGNKQHKAIILIHGYGISWRMWQPQIKAFSNDYFVIVPVLDGHDTENNSPFTTVEKAAADIIDYVLQTYGNQVFAICGASLGATIAADILAQNRLEIAKAIIDAGPIVPMNPFLLKLSVNYRISQAHSMKKGSRRLKQLLSRTFYPPEMVDDVFRIGANMTDESCRNVHLSVFNYALPPSIADTKTDITYWYGSKEAWLGKKYAACMLSIVPSVKIKIFKGLDHGELCIGNPDLYINEATEFFNA
ncbi:alpha/beta fold hydrolase [Acetobacterium bakii]|nr:alpha/beta hydrolase [Acetobacterium bakii]